jgi:hypothetical protein
LLADFVKDNELLGNERKKDDSGLGPNETLQQTLCSESFGASQGLGSIKQHL